MTVVFVEDLLYIFFSSFSRSVSYSLQFKRSCSGFSFTFQVEHSGEVLVSVLLLRPLSIEYPGFSVAILKIPFLEVFFERVGFSVNFLRGMQGAMSLFVLSFPIF